MKVIDLIRLLRKHFVLLLVSPLLLAGLVTYLTKNPVFKYDSETSLYTGIASGSSVEMDKSTNFFATNTAFDNLINIIKSRKTEEEVAIRLLSQHLLLAKFDHEYISEKSYNELKRITPAYIERLVSNNTKSSKEKKTEIAQVSETPIIADSLPENPSFSFNSINALNAPSSLPASIDQATYEQTVKNLTDYMASSDTNFVYRLLNFEHPHYSIKAIATINVQRIGTSDLVKLKYESDDPGICRQTLALLTEVCITNYKSIKENRSDAVVKYFEFQLKQAASRLKIAEDKLLEFNKENNIINYYEQSKAVAVVKEDLDVEYNNKRIKLAGIKAAIKRLEEKLGIQQQIQLKNTNIIEKRNQLGELNYKITSAETFGLAPNTENQNLADLKAQATKLKDEIRSAVGELYSYSNSTEGLPVSTILNDWINNVIEAENLKAGIDVLGERIKEFQKQYSIYAPAGANIKRIEREISVSEQEFLEILHGLGLAKLKLQDNELSSNIKAVDPPFFPISPVPTKRKILIIVGAMLGFFIVLITIFILEYFDSSLKKPTKASSILKLPNLGVLPKILLKASKINLTFIVNRLLEISIQNIELYLKVSKSENSTKTILFFSTLNQEGKSVVMGNLAQRFKIQGKKVLVLNYTPQSDILLTKSSTEAKSKERVSLVSLLFGYPDTRIDHESPFLQHPVDYLNETEYLNYQIDENFYAVKDYTEILKLNNFQLSFIPDYVLIELPSILFNSYPMELISNSDLPILVCRSNRVWTDSDHGVLDILMNLTKQKTHFILNGIDPLVIESILGDLPRKRSWLRRTIKNIFRFQFLTRNHI
jgi:succinoglycan biosynthesis transport protein ExoP